MSSNKSSIPNIVIWSWMRTVLDLSGTELLLFAFIFSQTFDNVHKVQTCLSEMESWFGITRQTISRNVDSMCSKNYVIKETYQDSINPMIKHNTYRVHIEFITQLCEDSDYSSYNNFLDSYRHVLKQKFPEDSKTIDEYLEDLSTWHKNKDTSVKIKLCELARLVSHTYDPDVSVSDALSKINKTEKTLHKSRESSFIQKDFPEPSEQTSTSAKKLFSEPKKKSKKALHNEWDIAKREMSHNFVYMRVGGNEELHELLNNFLDTDNGRSYTPIQWEQQLENLYRYGRTPERMIEGVRTTFMNNYRSLYLVDKSEVDIVEKLNEVDVYVAKEGENSEELKDLLCSYITDVQRGKSSTLKQFRLALKNLSLLCPTLEEKIKSVETSYANGYASLAYPNNKFTQQTNSNTEIDIDKKIDRIHKFISDGYYYLCDGLEDLLISYVKTTSNGKSMSYDKFCIILDNLRLLCLDDDDKIVKVKFAIQNDSDKFATEDFDETRKIKAKFETRETMATSFDRSRKSRVMQAKQRNPKDPRLCNVDLPKFPRA